MKKIFILSIVLMTILSACNMPGAAAQPTEVITEAVSTDVPPQHNLTGSPFHFRTSVLLSPKDWQAELHLRPSPQWMSQLAVRGVWHRNTSHLLSQTILEDKITFSKQW
jgi:hypothetical protein